MTLSLVERKAKWAGYELCDGEIDMCDQKLPLHKLDYSRLKSLAKKDAKARGVKYLFVLTEIAAKYGLKTDQLGKAIEQARKQHQLDQQPGDSSLSHADDKRFLVPSKNIFHLAGDDSYAFHKAHLETLNEGMYMTSFTLPCADGSDPGCSGRLAPEEISKTYYKLNKSQREEFDEEAEDYEERDRFETEIDGIHVWAEPLTCPACGSDY